MHAASGSCRLFCSFFFNLKLEFFLLIVVYRWEMAHTPLHAAAYALDPEFHGHEHDPDGEVMDGFNIMLGRLLPDGAQRGNAMVSYTDYLNKQGAFADPVMWSKARDLPAWKWWMTFAG